MPYEPRRRTSPRGREARGPRRVVPRPWRPLAQEPLVWLAAGLVLVGLVPLWWGLSHVGPAMDMKATPVPITCAELEAHGPPSCRNVVLTDYFVCETYVSESFGIGSFSDVLSQWVALVPWDSAYAKECRRRWAEDPKAKLPPPPDVHVIAHVSNRGSGLLDSAQTQGDETFNRMESRQKIQLFVCNGITEIKPDIADTLRRSYPRLDLDRCWHLDQSPRVPGLDFCIVAIVLGLAFLATAGFLVWRLRAQRSTMVEPETGYIRPRRPRSTA